MKSYKLNAVIEKDENGYYAFCPELEGCCTQGRTLDETMKNIREAMTLYLETLSTGASSRGFRFPLGSAPRRIL
jgi:predicted RNase H-like HicB family nuclease